MSDYPRDDYPRDMVGGYGLIRRIRTGPATRG